MSAGDIVGEPMIIHRVARGEERRERIAGLFQRVGLRPELIDAFPHEFSGGQRQRIGIARALSLNPELIVGDEPVSALDVSIQAQVVNLLEDLQNELDLTYVVIAHDLSVVRHISDRVAVMYLGKIVEIADRTSLYKSPMHPYTTALLSAVPIPDVKRRTERDRIRLQGDVPSPINPPPACRFHTRCWKAQEICKTIEPPLAELLTGHQVACHFPENAPQDATPTDAPTPAPAESAAD
jgi:peptide/nickel transport system ATP-binding protein/oligopeptide transport system ATP-binding protein